MACNADKLVSMRKVIVAAVLLTSFVYSYSWDRQVVDSNLYSEEQVNIDLALDTNDAPHVVYFENKDNSNFLSLAYAFIDDGSWTSTTIEQNYFGTATNPKVCLAIDANGVIYVVYPGDEKSVVYRKKQNGDWGSQQDIADPTSLVHDVAVDNNGLLSVVYSRYPPDGNYKDANLILFSDDERSTVDTHNNFQSASLAFDSCSIPHLCYYDDNNGLLKYAVRDGNSWTIQEVNSVGDVSSYIWGATSIAIDSNDVPHISYYNFTNFSLNYANKLLGFWKSWTVDANNNPGKQNSIAIDSNDTAHISYTVRIPGDDDKVIIKYAAFQELGFQIETVTDFNGVRAFLSLALDDSDKPHIAFDVPDSQTIEYAVAEICGDSEYPFPFGDADKNCFVDFFDLSLLGDRWLDTGCGTPDYCDGADLNKSTIVDKNDLDMLADTWLECSLSDCF